MCGQSYVRDRNLAASTGKDGWVNLKTGQHYVSLFFSFLASHNGLTSSPFALTFSLWLSHEWTGPKFLSLLLSGDWPVHSMGAIKRKCRSVNALALSRLIHDSFSLLLLWVDSLLARTFHLTEDWPWPPLSLALVLLFYGGQRSITV